MVDFDVTKLKASDLHKRKSCSDPGEYNNDAIKLNNNKENIISLYENTQEECMENLFNENQIINTDNE